MSYLLSHRAEYELIKKDNINESGDLTFQYLKLEVPTTDKENRMMEFRSYSFGIYPINSIMKESEIISVSVNPTRQCRN